MLRILHLADMHLGWVPPLAAPRAGERSAERDRLIERAVDFALDRTNAIGLVILAGDIFETHRPSSALAGAVMRQLNRLTAAGIRVITVPGNHDEITYHDSVYRDRAAEWPGILVQNPMPQLVATLDVGGTPCHVYSLAYTGGLTRIDGPLADFPRTGDPGYHIAVLHGSLDWNGGERSLPIDSDGLARAGYDYVALGHVHQHQVRPLARGMAVYPGAVEGKWFSDPGVGFFTVVELAGGVAVRQVPVDVRPVRTAHLDVGLYESPATLAADVAALGDRRALQLVRLRGTPAFPVDAAALATELADRFYHLEVVDETEGLASHLIDAWAREPTIRGQFVRRMQQAIAAAGEEERLVLRLALRYGLSALQGGGRR